MSGLVMTRVACELFQTPLASPMDTMDTDTKTSGMAWMFIDKNGALQYHIQLDGISQPDMLGLGK